MGTGEGACNFILKKNKVWKTLCTAAVWSWLVYYPDSICQVILIIKLSINILIAGFFDMADGSTVQQVILSYWTFKQIKYTNRQTPHMAIYNNFHLLYTVEFPDISQDSGYHLRKLIHIIWSTCHCHGVVLPIGYQDGIFSYIYKTVRNCRL